ncbi:MAG: fatty acyl-AMP ligase [Mycobacterium sp.]
MELLCQQAARCGEKVAFSFSYHGDGRDSAQVTYQELDTRARAIGAGLQRLGANEGSPVLVLCRPGLDGIAGMFGCWYAGAIAVPVSERVGPALSSVIADVRAGFAVASPATPASVRSAVDTVARVRGEPLVWSGTEEGDGGGWVAPVVDAHSVAMIQYRSGSRGVVVTHGNLMANLAALGQARPGGTHDVGVSWLPTHHGIGLVGAVLATIYAGATMVLLAPSAFMARPMRWLEAISRWRATVTIAPDFAYRLCVQRSTPAERAGLDLSTLSTAMNGVEPVRAATMRAFADAFAPAGFRREAFMPVYGLAEATGLVAGGSAAPLPVVRHLDRAALHADRVVDVDPDDPGAVEVVGCGRPRAQVVIVHPVTRRSCRPDAVGEVWIAGPSVARGYWAAPAATEQIFGAMPAHARYGPFLRSGDRGFVRGGQLFITGRCSDLVVVDGARYYPDGIEATVAHCHPVLVSGRGAVFAVAPKSGGAEQLVVVQEVSRRVSEAKFSEILRLIQAAITEHHGVQADSIILVQSMRIPTASSGEIQRGACRSQYLDGDLDPLAEWHTPGPAGEPREATVVELTQAVAVQNG